MRTISVKILVLVVILGILVIGVARCGNAPSKSSSLRDTSGDTSGPKKMKLQTKEPNDTSAEGSGPKKKMLKQSTQKKKIPN